MYILLLKHGDQLCMWLEYFALFLSIWIHTHICKYIYAVTYKWSILWMHIMKCMLLAV